MQSDLQHIVHEHVQITYTIRLVCNLLSCNKKAAQCEKLDWVFIQRVLSGHVIKHTMQKG